MAKREGKLALRYSRALLRALGIGGMAKSSSDGSYEQVREAQTALVATAALWESSKEVRSFVLNPMFRSADRIRALEALCRTVAAPKRIVEFVRVLFERDRISILPQVADAFVGMADEVMGLVRVEIVSARALEEEEAREVEQLVEKKVDGRPIFSWSTDSSLLGGVLVKFAGKALDGSIKGSLENMERQLLSA